MEMDGEFESNLSDGFMTRSENESESDRDDTSESGRAWMERKRKNLQEHEKPIKSVKTNGSEGGEGNVCVKKEEEGGDEEYVEKTAEIGEDVEEKEGENMDGDAENSAGQIRNNGSVVDKGSERIREAALDSGSVQKERNNPDDEDRGLTASPPDHSPTGAAVGSALSSIRPFGYFRSRLPPLSVQSAFHPRCLGQRPFRKTTRSARGDGFSSPAAEFDERTLVSFLARNALERNEAELQKGIDELVSLQKEIDQKLNEYRTGCASIRAKVDNMAKVCTDEIIDKVNKEVISCLSNAIPTLVVAEDSKREETVQVFSNNGRD